MSAYPRASNLTAYQNAATHGGIAAANPHGLIMMLLEGALERIAGARGRMVNGLVGEKAELIAKTLAIVDELRGSLDLTRGGEIAANLDALYAYISQQLIKANVDNRPELLDEVSSLLKEIHSAWIALPLEVRRGGL
jgi:flagellar protein FliS